MANPKSAFFCNACGHESPKWHGRCPGCGAWNSMLEELVSKPSAKSGSKISPKFSFAGFDQPSRPVPIDELEDAEAGRTPLGMQEFDRVLGGGCVPGSVILIGGDPGIGKSTLLLQALSALAGKGLRTLYVSGEESGQQIRLRAERLKVPSKNLWVLTETSMEKVFHTLNAEEHLKDVGVLCIDSVQTLFSEQLDAAAGSVSQIRMVTAMLVEFAKKTGCITFLIGHVTKEGSLAGPRVLEHMVDTVLYFETSHGHPYRILRTTKNRFGSTNEIGVFEMASTGLTEVKNPSELFLSERLENTPGSVVIVTLEGTRPILIEAQSLTLPCFGGSPRRTCIGVDSNRVALLAAVVQRELGMTLTDHDLYVNVAGGIKVGEPAADLGLVASMASARLQAPMQTGIAFFGEVGLSGEVRAVQQPGLRIQEAAKLGFTVCVLPKNNMKAVTKEEKHKGMTLKAISHIREMIPLLQECAARPVPDRSREATA